MISRSRAIGLGIVSAAVLAGAGWGLSPAFAATAGHTSSAAGHAPRHAITFSTEHVAGAKGKVLVEGRGLVVYTFTGDTRGKPGTCTGQCAVVWPPLHGTAVLAHGVRLAGKFGTIAGQVSYNGWPLYLFNAEKAGQNHADSAFKVVPAQAPAPKPDPMPTATSPGSW
jgi:predicted lipoprotein with Yx(FWY)xxD motif